MMNIYLLKDDIVEVKYTSPGNLADKKPLVVEPVRSFLKDYLAAESGNEIVISYC